MSTYKVKNNNVTLNTDMAICEVVLIPSSPSCEKFTVKLKGPMFHQGRPIKGNNDATILLGPLSAELEEDLQLHADLFFKAIVEILEKKG